MTYTKRLIILAKSIKHQRFCIAGKDYETHDWIRPVKNLPFTHEECRNFSGSRRSIQVFDFVEMTFIERSPKNYQPENEIVDMNVEWRLIGHFTIENLNSLVDSYDVLELIQDNVFDSDILPSLNLQNSLQLIRISEENNAQIYYKQDFSGAYYKPRLLFNYKELEYDLPITDPIIPLESSSITPRTLRNAYITIGIGEPYRDQHYFFVVMLREINN